MPTQLQQAIAAVKAGDKRTGQRLLAEVLKAEPRNETAWLWLATLLDDPEKKKHCLHKVLQIDPDNPAARKGLAQLEPPAAPEPEAVELPRLEDIAPPLPSEPLVFPPGLKQPAGETPPPLPPKPAKRSNLPVILGGSLLGLVLLCVVCTIGPSFCLPMFMGLNTFGQLEEGAGPVFQPPIGLPEEPPIWPPDEEPPAGRSQQTPESTPAPAPTRAVIRAGRQQLVDLAAQKYGFAWQERVDTGGVRLSSGASGGERQKLNIWSGPANPEEIGELYFSFRFSHDVYSLPDKRQNEEFKHGLDQMLEVVSLALPHWNGGGAWIESGLLALPEPRGRGVTLETAVDGLGVTLGMGDVSGNEYVVSIDISE